MAAPLFPPAGLVMPKPDWGFKESPQADIQEDKLGDGYVFREPKGINHIKRSFPMTWSELDPDVAEEAYDWLLPMLALKPLRIVHPVRGTVHQVILDSIDLTYDVYNNAVLNATFTEDFNPAGG